MRERKKSSTILGLLIKHLSHIEPDLQAGGQNPLVRLFVRHLKTEGKGKSGDGEDDDLNVPVTPPQDVAQQ